MENWDIASWYPKHLIFDETDWLKKPKWAYEVKINDLVLCKCPNCIYAHKLADGRYICKYSKNNGEPEKDTCNYERRTN